MKYTKEQRAGFELWANTEFFVGLHNISEDWDEERNCYKDFAFHMAFHAWLDANNQYEHIADDRWGAGVYRKVRK